MASLGVLWRRHARLDAPTTIGLDQGRAASHGGLGAPLPSLGLGRHPLRLS